MKSRRLVALAFVASAVVPPAHALIPDVVPSTPVFTAQVPRGAGLRTTYARDVSPSSKFVDGDTSDWTGDITRYAGTSVYSHGEYVYQDYLMDDWGADDGQDVRRLQATDEIANLEPRAYKPEVLAQRYGGRLGEDCPKTVCAADHYGDVTDPAYRNEADIEEVRVAASLETLYLLIRTTGMSNPSPTAVMLLLGGPVATHDVPGGLSTTARYAILVSGEGVASFTDSGVPANSDPIEVASSPTGFTNAIEIGIPRYVVPSLGATLRLALATGLLGPDGVEPLYLRPGEAKADYLNVAFRHDEPARMRMDHGQAISLHDGNIDHYAEAIEVAHLVNGYTESFEPRSGYWERIYVSAAKINAEADVDDHFQGTFQQYGVYLPQSFHGGSTELPTTWWEHARGGSAHEAATWLPGAVRAFGDEQSNIMIFPSGRGATSWSMGRAMVDFLEVWTDATAHLPIDEDRMHIAGYSMGGFGTWLLSTLLPDHFAAASSFEGPPTQGVFLGLGPNANDPPESSAFDGGDVQAELTYVALDNLSNLPVATYQGTNDPFVPLSGIEAMHKKLTDLGDANRLYRFGGAEHESFAISDSWREAAAYVNGFTRVRNPEHVRYRRWPALEHAVSTRSVPTGVDLGLRFDSAYWVSGLEVRDIEMRIDGRPDPMSYGTIDVTTNGHGRHSTISFPEVQAGQEGTPYEMTGWRTVSSGSLLPANTFDATLTNVSSATLDLDRMGLSTSAAIEATIATDGPTTMRLSARWGQSSTVVVCLQGRPCSSPAAAAYDEDGRLAITLGQRGTYLALVSP